MPIDDVVWPPTLQQLTFGGYFDQPIEDVVWPESLRELSFGRAMRMINHIDWGVCLRLLTVVVDPAHFMESSFTVPVRNVWRDW